ncbi:tRNA uridine-5-carboxymethylaminomethyl(34) synthesis GTPase MnmE [Candidatus Magnetaquicoccus inordinatus]|uniref:tRNA uridine-5-carboxymethylaminomethyl(34) synthesis GTPase MnmE n=1 Tax=Candidatus Magnetaquicoccus inordinatus TaxID=2496818 RepID=UPI00102C35E9|nr:tRNA uridine-5-carboxymethylaminomethyl(34) synthesis GTPase MnmE [Candidatus Magnetaquicoccus inordinatus]
MIPASKKLADPIAALATPMGSSGVAVIRLSGSGLPNSILPLVRDSKGRELTRNFFVPRQLMLVQLVEPQNLQTLDQCLIVYFQAPNSFTGEDQLEIHTHGSPILIKRVLVLLATVGIRSAYPGEFSKRAFLNGKIDLTRAEAIMALVHASSLNAVHEAARQMQGSMAKCWQSLRETLLTILVQLEAELDFADEEIEFSTHEFIINKLLDVRSSLEKLISSAQTGKQWQEGFHIVIVGKTNVGKSSLFNKLLEKDKAIVTDIHGTTRDIIEQSLEWSGIQFLLADTAGLRETQDTIEIEGMRRAHDRVKTADGVIIVYDIREGFGEAERNIANQHTDGHILYIANKLDLVKSNPLSNNQNSEMVEEIKISCKTGEGVDVLRNKIIDKFTTNQTHQEGSVILVARQLGILHNCYKYTNAALDLATNRSAYELIVANLRYMLEEIADLVGEIGYDELLNNIFSKFCIGK